MLESYSVIHAENGVEGIEAGGTKTIWEAIVLTCLRVDNRLRSRAGVREKNGFKDMRNTKKVTLTELDWMTKLGGEQRPP